MADGFTVVSIALMAIVMLGTLALLAQVLSRSSLQEAVWPSAGLPRVPPITWPRAAAPGPSVRQLVEEFDQLGSSFAHDERIGSWIVGPVPDEGVYRMLVWPGHLAWHIVGAQPARRIATQARLAAEAPNGYAGLVVRYLDAQNFHMFVVDGSGNFRVQQQVDGAWRDIQPWTASPVLAPAGDANTLTVEEAGGELRFSANNSLLYTLKSTDIAAGAAGIVTGALDAEMVRSDFDWYESEFP